MHRLERSSISVSSHPAIASSRSGQSEADLHRLALGQCSVCGLVQLVDPMPAGIVRPQFSWLTYNEPEGHLDVRIAVLSIRAASAFRFAVTLFGGRQRTGGSSMSPERWSSSMRLLQTMSRSSPLGCRQFHASHRSAES